jgi:HlyD family secretion protein
VNTSQNSLNTAKAALATAQAQNQQGLESAKASVDQSLSSVLTAQDTVATDQPKQQASIQTAQNSADQAQQALTKSQATLQNTIAQQNAALQSAQNTVAQNQAALQTQQATAAQTLAGPTQPDLDTANALVANAQLALQTADSNLQAATLLAPTGGVVASLNGTVGQWIGGGATSSISASSATASTASTTGSAFITLMDLTSPQISAAVSEADIGKIQTGQNVNFTVTAFPGRTFTGSVAAVEPAGTTTSNVVTYIVLISADPTDVQLLPDMTATLTIITQQATNAIVVPNSAIAWAQSQPAPQTSIAAQPATTPAPSKPQSSGSAPANGTQPVVYVLQNGAPVRVPIQTGITDGVTTQVTTGLQTGDQVITGGGSASKSGSSPSSSTSSAGSRSILPAAVPKPGG